MLGLFEKKEEIVTPAIGQNDLQEMVSIFAEASADVSTAAQPNPKFNPFKGSSAPTPEQIGSDTSLSQYPHVMSCTQAFDLLVGCFSLGGQIKSYYRYGTLANCEDQLTKFKFCISNSTKSGAEKEQGISQWYKESWAQKKASGSSEDVWDAKK
ncbi:hypothetical protein BABINDRAFT_160136 [Babjeviella inositovora NRRL Y-12698]|uniref:Early meiotic induction protein 1 n=1 Tax=Babjeviella inositovora NRRL Y-12698 TaxID=984486 RepID=A0A1E3QW55_9ASCO|nr:uncharacterized protein BABINDRAFT_160136 [Babjeviella inositovora NRRL Y-12698]ODQ81906.1 hypothetical protein BABINDRAFT_160136 [Babjeviella inositovora NRRL Y-12698]